MSSILRIATIGAWGHLGEPLSEIVPMEGVRLVAHARALPDDDIAFVRHHTRDDSIPWFDDYHQMLREARPDVVIVSTRIDRIGPIAIDAAEAGCHLICEKPLAIDHAGLKHLFDVVRTQNVQCLAMLGNARHPVMQAAMGVIKSGEIGNVALLNARKSYRWGERPDWFGKRSIYGGTIGWIAIHALEMIHDLTGADFVSVAAMQSNLVHPERPECEDSGALLVKLSSGATASVSFDLLRPQAAASHGDDWLRIVGSLGLIEASLDRGSCICTTQTRAEREISLPPRGSYYAPFLAALATASGTLLAETRRGFMLTHACLCARDAADRSTVEKISKGPWNATPAVSNESDHRGAVSDLPNAVPARFNNDKG